MKFFLIKQLIIQAAILLVVTASRAPAQTYRIKGELEATYYSWTGKLGSTQTTSFSINIEENRWLLKTEYAPNWFSLTGGDGTNTYHVLVDPNATKLPAPASIFYGDFPQDQFDRVSIPWLVFCSSHFLNHLAQTDAIPSLWSQAQTDPMSHICSTEIVPFTERPYLPKEIKWITSLRQIALASSNRFLRIEGATAKELDKKSIDFKSDVQAGETLGSYHVINTTNIDGLIIPLEFELNAYGYFSPKQRDYAQRILDSVSKTNNLLKYRQVGTTYLVAVYKGTVAEVSSDSNHVALPEPMVAMSITDYRLSSRSNGIDFVSYKSKDWKPQVDAELLNLLDAKKKNPPNNLSANSVSLRSRNVIRAAILIVFFAPLFYWGLRKLKNKKTKVKGNT